MQRISLSIVMAAYNEEDALPDCAARNLAFLREYVADGELIIVNDGSADGTAALIDKMAAAEPEVKAVHLPQNGGMGAALLGGFAVAQKEWVTIMPADGQIDPYEIMEFFTVADDADLITSLYRNREYPLGRKILSLGLRTLTAVVVGTRARTEGIYVVRRAVLEQLGARSHSFLLNLEIPIRAKRSGFRVKTVYMNVHPRAAGHSKATSFGRVKQTFTELFKLRIAMERERLSRLRGR